MNFSSWDWWDAFRLHEAACLIAGVPVGPNRAPEPEEIPADARPVLKRLISAFYQGQDYLKLPEKIGCHPAKILIGFPRDGTEAMTEFLVSREELHRWIQAMGFKSVYQFLPLEGNTEPVPVGAVSASDDMDGQLAESPPQTPTPSPAPVATESASGGVEADKAGPRPLTTNEVANCFAGFREWDVKRWKRELGSPDKWLKDCQHSKGTRGKGGYESTWYPVKIALALTSQDPKSARHLPARFKRVEQLNPWLEELENNIPDNSDIL